MASLEQQLLIKGQLAAWATKHPGVPTLTNYGTSAEDLNPQWTARDALTLGDFSKWWNLSGGSPQLPTTASQQPSEAHVYALTLWAAGQLGQPLPVPGLPTGASIPSRPEGWPAALPWPLVGSEKPPGWPAGWSWPPALPAGLPTGIQWPIPLPPIPGAPTTTPPVTEPGGATGPLPPPPPPKDGEKKEKKSIIWWVLGGVAAVVVAATYWESQEDNATRRKNPVGRSYSAGYKAGLKEGKMGEALDRPAYVPAEEEDWWDGYYDGVHVAEYGTLPDGSPP